MTIERKWKSGRPPHVGWWNASTTGRCSIWRWWNGEFWSQACDDDDTPTYALECAQLRDDSVSIDTVWWTDYWPENARVPRVSP
jgi:hypothetical protein